MRWWWTPYPQCPLPKDTHLWGYSAPSSLGIQWAPLDSEIESPTPNPPNWGYTVYTFIWTIININIVSEFGGFNLKRNWNRENLVEILVHSYRYHFRFWYSERYFVPNVTKIRFQIKPHIFYFFMTVFSETLTVNLRFSRFLGVSEIEN